MKNRKAFTLMEVLLASAVMVLVATGAFALMLGTMRGFNYTFSQASISSDVAGSILYMTRDLEEAKEVDVLTTDHIRIYFPVVTASGTYDNMLMSSTGYVDYFRCNTSGTYTATGNCIARQKQGQTAQITGRGITQVVFSSDSPGSIDVSLTAAGDNGTTFSMVHRAIFLRNY